MIHIKSTEELATMRKGGSILANILHELAISTRIGIKTADLNRHAEALMAKFNVDPSFKGYHGYPSVICTSVNEEVVHAIPGDRVLFDGDIISIDCGIVYGGFHTDAAVTVMLGNVEPEVKKFVLAVQKSFEKALEIIKPGATTGDIGFTIQHFIESHGYSVVRDYIGHGVGRNLHEEPQVPNFGKKGKGTSLVPGMTIAVEPIINIGERFVTTLKDGWTVVTRDLRQACQIEHTIAITHTGYEVLTIYNNAIKSIYSQ